MSEGGARSRLWRKIVCDMLEIPGVYLKNSSGAPLGNAILAGVGVGVFKDFSIAKKWTDIEDRIDPDQKNIEIYKKYYPLFIDLYKRNKDMFEKLATIKTSL